MLQHWFNLVWCCLDDWPFLRFHVVSYWSFVVVHTVHLAVLFLHSSCCNSGAQFCSEKNANGILRNSLGCFREWSIGDWLVYGDGGGKNSSMTDGRLVSPEGPHYFLMPCDLLACRWSALPDFRPDWHALWHWKWNWWFWGALQLERRNPPKNRVLREWENRNNSLPLGINRSTMLNGGILIIHVFCGFVRLELVCKLGNTALWADIDWELISLIYDGFWRMYQWRKHSKLLGALIRFFVIKLEWVFS